jgi:WD40 repeat protein
MKKTKIRAVAPSHTFGGELPMRVLVNSTCAVVSRDGSTLYTGHLDGTIRVWDARTGVHTRTWLHPRSTSQVYAIALTPDGALLASTTGRGVTLRKLPHGSIQVTLGGVSGTMIAMKVLPRGDGVVVGADNGSAAVVSLDGFVQRSVLQRAAVTAVEAGDGFFATACHEPVTSITLWHLDATPRGALRAPGGHPPTTLARSAGTLFAGYIARADAEPSLAAWDVDRGELLWERHGFDNIVDIAVLDEGRRLVTAHQDGPLRVWDAETGTMLHRFDCTTLDVRPWGAPTCVAPSPDGTLFVGIAHRRFARLAREGAVLTPHDPPAEGAHRSGVRALAFLGEGALASLGRDGEVARWDFALRDPTVRARPGQGTANGIRSAGKDLLVRTAEGVEHLRGSNLRRLPKPTAHTFEALEEVASLARDGRVTLALPGGTRALLSSREGALVVDRATGETLVTLDGLRGPATALAVSAKGARVAASDGETIAVWKLPR